MKESAVMLSAVEAVHTPPRYGRPDATMRTLPHRAAAGGSARVASTLIPLMIDGSGAPARRT